MRNSRTALVALCAAAALGLAACGSSSSGKSTGGSTPSSAASSGRGRRRRKLQRRAKASPRTRSPSRATSTRRAHPASPKRWPNSGAKARFARANTEGGVNGRKINYLGAADNKLDPSQDLSTVKKIVEQDKAFAIVPMVSPMLAQGGTYLVTNKVPFFGWGITPAFCNNDVGFGFTGCLVPIAKDDEVSTASAGLIDKLLGHQGRHRQDRRHDLRGRHGRHLRHQGHPGGVRRRPLEGHLREVGASLERPVTDFSPYTQAILTSNGGKAPDVVFHVTTVPNVVGLSSALTNAGFKGPQENAVTYDPAFLQSAASRTALNNGYVFIQYGSFQNGSAANTQMLKDVQAVDPSQKVLTQDIAIGYYSADIFLQRPEEDRQEPEPGQLPDRGQRRLHVLGPGRTRRNLLPEEPPELRGLRIAGPDSGHQVRREGPADLLHERAAVSARQLIFTRTVRHHHLHW